jgi:hypothetical protein
VNGHFEDKPGAGFPDTRLRSEGVRLQPNSFLSIPGRRFRRSDRPTYQHSVAQDQQIDDFWSFGNLDALKLTAPHDAVVRVVLEKAQ